MALKIRCTDCRKKISVDEAFAGGVCRCPYCKAIVMVGGEAGDASLGGRPEAPAAARPEAPTAGGRPEGPAEVAPAAAPTDVAPEQIPTANPVRIQGIVTVVLTGGLVVMLGLMIWLVVEMMGPAEPPVAPGVPESEVPPPPVNPFVPAEEGPAVAGMRFEPPVVYVIDASSSMQPVFGYADAMTQASILSMSPDQRFTVLVMRERGDELLAEGYRSAGAGGADAAGRFLNRIRSQGRSNLARGLRAALRMTPQPKTIVVFARRLMDDALPVGQQAGDAGVKLIAVGLDIGQEVAGSLDELARAANGQAVDFPLGDLEQFYDQIPWKLRRLYERDPGPRVNPFVPAEEGPAAAGVRIEPPVVYVIGASSSMRPVFGYAAAMTQASILSMSPDRQFAVLVMREGGDDLLADGYRPAGQGGADAASRFLYEIFPQGSADVPAGLRRALEMTPQPKTIVVFARRLMDDALPVGQQADAAGVKLIAVGLDVGQEVAGSLDELARAANGQAVDFSLGDLEQFHDRAPPLD